MLFTRLGYFIAAAALILGVLIIISGVTIALGMSGAPQEAVAKFYPSASSTGEVIDKGTYMVLFAVALGVVTEIGHALRGIKTKDLI